MDYLECVLNTPSEEMDARCEELEALGVEGGFVIEDEADFRRFLEQNHQYWDYVDDELRERFDGLSRLKFYLEDGDEGRRILSSLREKYPALIVSRVRDSDWENNWRQYYRPIEIGERIVVVPEWEEIPSSGRVPLRLDPGLIFGTGSHATTRMCLATLEEFSAPGLKVLDLGCGSGILGIGALLLGCESCLGCDIDPKAADVVMRNASLNGIGPDRMRVLSGDLLKDASLRRRFGAGYDLVLANIVADVIRLLAPLVPSFLKPGGVFISSGIIEGRQAELEKTIRDAGFEILSHRSEEEWHCFVARLPA